MSQTLLGIETVLGSIGRGFASAPITIGGITLTGAQAPSEFTIGGQQQVVIHKLPGGDRIINAIGNDPNRLTLAGTFFGPNTTTSYQGLASLRQAGTTKTLSIMGQSLLVVIVGFRYTLQQRGAVVPYSIEVEVVPQLASSLSTTGTSALASLIGPDTASAISSVTSTIAGAATYVQNTVGQVQTIAGEALPVASLVGLGGPLAGISDDLTAASALSGSATNLAGVPATLSSFVTDMQSAGSGLMSAIGSAGSSVTGISTNAANGIASDGPSLQDATAQAGVLAGSVQAGAYVNRSLGWRWLRLLGKRNRFRWFIRESGMPTYTTDRPTTLFQVALDQFSDPLVWWQIAQLNGLSDPSLPRTSRFRSRRPEWPTMMGFLLNEVFRRSGRGVVLPSRTPIKPQLSGPISGPWMVCQNARSWHSGA